MRISLYPQPTLLPIIIQRKPDIWHHRYYTLASGLATTASQPAHQEPSAYSSLTSSPSLRQRRTKLNATDHEPVCTPEPETIVLCRRTLRREVRATLTPTRPDI